MSFLTPLYLLGALAISLPVLFHMIRRMPRDRREFSSTMFLQPSPPKITRRSRIEHWLLLLLRALAVGLLALAFARPFFRETASLATGQDAGSAIVVLLDRSASMQRDDLWTRARAQLEQVLHEDVGVADQVAVLVFDDQTQAICDFQQWTEQEPAQRASTVIALAEDLEVSWRATDLGTPLVEAAELLDALQTGGDAFRQRKVIVISDLQAGADIDALQTFEWPEGIAVELKRIGQDISPNNAGIQLVDDLRSSDDAQRLRRRVLVVNSAGADLDEFVIRWKDEFDQADEGGDAARDDRGVTVIVPAGASRIVRAAPRPTEQHVTVGRLVIEGDEHGFDNTCFVPPPRSRTAVVALAGGEREDPQSMRFYLPAAFPSLPGREIQVVDWKDRAADGAISPDLVIALDGTSTSVLDSLREYGESGGVILSAAATAETLNDMLRVLRGVEIDADEANVEDYAMLTGIDFRHPLFSALGDSRFSDFTKVRFWKYRVLETDSIPEAQILASFDTGGPAIFETPLGNGRLIVFAGGWHPDDSQLGASSKFVPMLNGLVDDVAGIVERQTSYLVGDTVTLSEFGLGGSDVEAVSTPDGQQLKLDSGTDSFRKTDLPGVYRFVTGPTTDEERDSLAFAVNLAPAESRTWPMSEELLRQAGLPLEVNSSAQVINDSAQRQLRAAELENRQKMWRWIIFAVIGLLMMETLLAGRAARRQLSSS